MSELLTYVDENEICSQFSNFDEIAITEAKLICDQFQNVFQVEAQLDTNFRLGAMGGFLLWFNAFAFDYLDKFRLDWSNSNEELWVVCKDVVNYWEVNSAEDFSRQVARASSEREFFMTDEDHRYMSWQLAENWTRPDIVRIHVEVSAVDGAFGVRGKLYDFYYEESVENWKRTNPSLVLLEPYEKRLRMKIKRQ
jgi:hypothetical protein